MTLPYRIEAAEGAKHFAVSAHTPTGLACRHCGQTLGAVSVNAQCPALRAKESSDGE